MTAQPAITHVIYDMDGLLLDTERFYTEVSRVICARYGKVFDWSLKAKMMGRPALDSARALTEALELPISPEDYIQARRPLLDRLFPDAEPLPGAVELTRRLAACGVPQAVASSSDRRTFELKVTRHRDWFDLFACVVLGDDPAVSRGKPAPDIFLAAAARLGTHPSRCLVFEDAPAGIRAARAAGMSVIAVPDPNLDRSACREADQVLGSLAEFDPAAWGFPQL